MRQSLNVVAGLLTGGKADVRTLDWSALRFQHTNAVRAALMARYRPATANKIIVALRGTLKSAWRLGFMDAETYHRAVDIPAVKGETLLQGRALSTGEIQALFRVCDDGTKAGVRDAAIFSFLYGAGLRRSEVVSIDLADVDLPTGAVVLRKTKGNKERIVYLTNGGLDAVSDWITLRGSSLGPLFCPIDRIDRMVLRGMSPQSIFILVRTRGREAAIAKFSPHDLRRTFISELFDAGADVSAVRALAGHSSVSTTARYDRRGEAAKKKAIALLHVPYVSRLSKNRSPDPSVGGE